jgi:hypothetical protein
LNHIVSLIEAGGEITLEQSQPFGVDDCLRSLVNEPLMAEGCPRGDVAR